MSEEYGNDFITLTDEEGNEVELEHLDTLEYEGETYMAFVQANDTPEEVLDEDSAELIILKVEPEDGEDMLVTIDDYDLQPVRRTPRSRRRGRRRRRFQRRRSITARSPCVVRDSFVFNPQNKEKGFRVLPWFAGLPSAVCGWKLEVVKWETGCPPGRSCAGYFRRTRPYRGEQLDF